MSFRRWSFIKWVSFSPHVIRKYLFLADGPAFLVKIFCCFILAVAAGGGPAAVSEGTRRGCAQGEGAGEEGP